MSTVIDANILAALFSKNYEDARDARIRGLIADSRTTRSRLVVPTPADSGAAVLALGCLFLVIVSD